MWVGCRSITQNFYRNQTFTVCMAFFGNFDIFTFCCLFYLFHPFGPKFFRNPFFRWTIPEKICILWNTSEIPASLSILSLLFRHSVEVMGLSNFHVSNWTWQNTQRISKPAPWIRSHELFTLQRKGSQLLCKRMSVNDQVWSHSVQYVSTLLALRRVNPLLWNCGICNRPLFL